MACPAEKRNMLSSCLAPVLLVIQFESVQYLLKTTLFSLICPVSKICLVKAISMEERHSQVIVFDTE
jgi:hypothetical protein